MTVAPLHVVKSYICIPSRYYEGSVYVSVMCLTWIPIEGPIMGPLRGPRLLGYYYSSIALDGYDARMNRWDDELKDFILLAEKKCRTYKDDQIEWSPTIEM